MASPAQPLPSTRTRKRSLSPESDASSSHRSSDDGDGEDADDRQPSAATAVEKQPAKRVKLGLGAIASAALEQWGLDEARVLAWAAEKGLPGVGIADLTTYRAEHPDEDLVAGVADLE